MRIIPLHILKKVMLVVSIICLTGVYVLAWREKTHDVGASLVFVLDVSTSMQVRDMQGASRLEAAKEYIQEILIQYPHSRAALTVFAGDSLRILPFTQERDLFLTFLEAVDEHNVSKQGTRIDLALQDAIENFYDTQEGTIIVLSDGDDRKTILPESLLEKSRGLNLDIVFVWVGTEEGGYIPTGDIFSPYKLYKWKAVVSRLGENYLRDIANQLWGKYTDSEDIPIFENSKTHTAAIPSFLLLLAFLSWCGFLCVGYYEIYKR